RTSQKAFDRFDSIGVVRYRPQSPALRPSPISQSNFFNVALQHPVPVESKLAHALDAVHGRRLLRQLNQIAAVRRYQEAVIRLQVSSNLAKGRQFVGRIEEK